MNKFTLISISFLISASLQAQKVTVSAQSEKVKGESAEGYSTEIEGKKDEVGGAWVKFLKEIGKVRQSTNPMTITEPVLNDQVAKGTLYAVTKEKGDKTYVWLGAKPVEWETTSVNIKSEIEKAVYRFGVKYYRDKIQVQIDDAQEALDAVNKQKQKITNQTNDLTIQLGNNEQEKIQLDKSIENNKYQNAILKVKLDNNRKAQDSLAQAVLQIEKVKQIHVERQRKVN